MSGEPTVADLLFFRTPDGSVYGPVDVATLCLWATDARVIPGCLVSEDKTAWRPAECLPELRLHWTVRFADGSLYGPMNLLAIWLLAEEKSIPLGSAVTEAGAGRTGVLDGSLLPLLVEEGRLMLAGCGSLMGRAFSRVQGSHQETLASLADRDASLADRDARLADLQAKLSQAEHDLENQLKLVSASQWRLAESESLVTKSEAQSLEVARLSTDLEALRAEREADYARRTELERRLAEADVRSLDMSGERDRLVARVEQLEPAAAARPGLEAELAGAESRNREATGQTNALKAQLQALSVTFQDLKTCLAQKEQALLEQEAIANRVNEETGTRIAGLETHLTTLEREKADTVKQRDALTDQLAKMRDMASKAQKDVRRAERKLEDERGAVQKDINSLLLASRCVKEVAGLIKPKPTSIDWMNSPGGGGNSGSGDDLESRFGRMTFNEKVVALQQELQSSAEEKNLLRQELETLKGRYDFLQKDAGRREKESAEKFAQIQKEIKTSSGLVDQALKEVEKREALVRDLRKRAGAQDPAPPVEILDAEVVHLEVLGPDDHGHSEPEPVMMDRPAKPQTESRPKGGILNSVEEQLQRELKHWEALKQEKKDKGGAFGKWFRRNTP